MTPPVTSVDTSFPYTYRDETGNKEPSRLLWRRVFQHTQDEVVVLNSPFFTVLKQTQNSSLRPLIPTNNYTNWGVKYLSHPVLTTDRVRILFTYWPWLLTKILWSGWVFSYRFVLPSGLVSVVSLRFPDCRPYSVYMWFTSPGLFTDLILGLVTVSVILCSFLHSSYYHTPSSLYTIVNGFISPYIK